MAAPREATARGRWALAAFAAGCALLIAAAPRAAADAAQVTVIEPGGSQRALSLAALAGREDVRERSYTLRSPQGETTREVTGFSLAALLEAAGADPYAFSYLEAQRPAGGSVLLSSDQALDAGAFQEGPPVVYAAAAGTGFLRPSGGPDDANATDSFEAPQGIALVLRRGEALRVSAEASPLRTRPGRPVSFSAVVERAGAGEQLSYSWYFDDGHSASGAHARHSFAKRGSYDVVVGVTTRDDRAGVSAVVTVQVGAPLSGPDRKGGGRNRDARAPDHGAATGRGGSAPPSSGGGATTAAGGPTQSPAPATSGRAERQSRPAPVPPGERVRGVLLSAPRAPAPPASKSVAARTGKLDEDGGGGGLPDAALGLLVTAGLLGLGALTELRGALR